MLSERKESNGCKLRMFSVLSTCMLTSSRVMVTRVGDKYRNTDAVVLSEGGEVTRISVRSSVIESESKA